RWLKISVLRRDGRLLLGRPHLHSADEADALALHGADQLLLFAAVPDCLAHRVEPAGKRRFRNDAAAPDRRDEIVLADHPVAIAHEMDKDIEHLRRDRDRRGPAQQFAPFDIKRVIGKEKLHLSPQSGRTWPKAIVKDKSNLREAQIKGP